MKTNQISANGDSARLGGGVNTHEVINALAVHGKVTGEYLPHRPCSNFLLAIGIMQMN